MRNLKILTCSLKLVFLISALLTSHSISAEPTINPLRFSYEKNSLIAESPDEAKVTLSMLLKDKSLLDIDRDATLNSIAVYVGERKIPRSHVTFNSSPTVLSSGARLKLKITDLKSQEHKTIVVSGSIHYFLASDIDISQSQKLPLQVGQKITFGAWELEITKVEGKRRITFNVNNDHSNLPPLHFFNEQGGKVEAHSYSRTSTLINGDGTYTISYELDSIEPVVLVSSKTKVQSGSAKTKSFRFEFTTPY